MPLRVNTNIPALNVRRILNINNRDMKSRIERLSSGLRINRAADDPAGLSVSEGMRSELTGLRQSVRNAEHATNLIQTGEGALNEVNSILIRMRELAVQSASSTVNDNNRESINAEYVQLFEEVNRIATVTSYNNTSLLRGFGNTINPDAGAASTALASDVTGVVDVSITGAEAGVYTFVDASNADNEITLGNGITTQTIDIGTALDTEYAGEGAARAAVPGTLVATGSSIVANFDRLGIQLTITGFRPEATFTPASSGYRDGGLDARTLTITPGVGGSFQIGPDNGAVHRIEVNIKDMSASGSVLNLGDSSTSNISSARLAINSVDLAIDKVAQQRGDLGAYQNRLAFNIRANENAIENLQASESSIRDADIGAEISAFTRAQILLQSGTALLAQANVIPQNALVLLG